MVIIIEACVHHWLFGPPEHDGRDVSVGICKKCGVEKEECNHFSTAVVSYVLNQRRARDRKYMPLDARM